MEIAAQISKSKSDAKAQARKVYFDTMTKQLPDGESLSDDELSDVVAAMHTLGISPEEGEADANAYKAVLAAQAAVDSATEEYDILKPKGDRSFREQIDAFDCAIKRDLDALLRPKRALLEQLERFEAASEVLKNEQFRLGTQRRNCPRLCG